MNKETFLANVSTVYAQYIKGLITADELYTHISDNLNQLNMIDKGLFEIIGFILMPKE
jgi:hypothetical protein